MGQKDLPVASGAAHVKAFERAAFVCLPKRRGNGKHFILEKAGVHLSIPDHKEVKRALLQKQIKLAGLTEAEYLDYFHKRR